MVFRVLFLRCDLVASQYHKLGFPTFPILTHTEGTNFMLPSIVEN